MQGTLSRIDKHEYEKYYYFKNAVDLTHGRKNLPEEQSGWIEEKGMWFLIESIPVNSNETFKSKSGKVITCEVKHVI